MAFYQRLALNATTLASAQTGVAMADPGRWLHGFFINQADSVGTTLTTAVEIWAQNLSGTYVKISPSGNPDTDEWLTAIGSGAGDYQKYLSLGDANTEATNSRGGPLQLPYVEGGKWRIVVNPTNGTADDTMVVVALLSEGLS